MLVLSRRPGEKLLFPSLDITLHLLEIKGNQIKIGIQAPPQVKVLRAEVAEVRGPASFSAAASPSAPKDDSERTRRHALRNQLNKLRLSLHLFERLWRAGQQEEAGKALARALEALNAVEHHCMSPKPSTRKTPEPRQPVLRSLLVEDDHQEREMLAQHLRLNGCACETAADGLEALDYLASHERPDVVLLDLRLPRCDGAETLARIRSNPRYAGLKIFAVSGTAPEELGIRSGPDGVNAWFPKPVNLQELWKAMQDSCAAGED